MPALATKGRNVATSSADRVKALPAISPLRNLIIDFAINIVDEMDGTRFNQHCQAGSKHQDQ